MRENSLNNPFLIVGIKDISLQYFVMRGHILLGDLHFSYSFNRLPTWPYSWSFKVGHSGRYGYFLKMAVMAIS